MITRRRLLDLAWKTAAAVPFASMLPRWYGTAQQWSLHAKEGVLRLAQQGRLVEVPPSALSNHPIPAGFVSYGPKTPSAIAALLRWPGDRWLGHWQDAHGRILAWVDRTGRAWWAKP